MPPFSNTEYAVLPVVNETLSVDFRQRDFASRAAFDCLADDHPQLHRSLAAADDDPRHRCSSCAAGEFLDRTQRQCLKCPRDTFKAREGVEQCTPCAAGTITGNRTGCTQKFDCYGKCLKEKYHRNTAGINGVRGGDVVVFCR